jgi:uncharacterized protein YjbI with pentapeptide repeats
MLPANGSNGEAEVSALANLEQLAILKQGVAAWNVWRDTRRAVRPDLSEADLSEMDLTGANLEWTDLFRANLSWTRFAEARLWGATFREANLTHADLRGAIGLWEESLAGADLSGALVPEVLRLSAQVAAVEDTFNSLQQVFLSIVFACLYSWLTIAATTDARLLSDSATSPLPIIGIQIPIAEFYLVTPFLLLSLYAYFHLSLQRLWTRLAALPAVFPDGGRLDQKSYPRILSGFVRSRCHLLQTSCPFQARVQAWLFIVVTWGLGPLMLMWFWWRYLARREWVGGGLLLGFLVLALVIAFISYRLASRTLHGQETRLYHEGVAVFVVSAAICGLLFYGKANGWPPHEGRNECIGAAWEVIGVWKGLREMLACSPYANLSRAQLSTKPAQWTGPENNALVQGAFLQGKNLCYARAVEAFLVKANLSGVDLQQANLQQAHLQQAILHRANLSHATLLWAQLQGADLRGAILQGIILRQAKLRGAWLSRFTDCNQRCLPAVDLSGANLVEADLQEADLKEVILRGAHLDGASLLRAQLQGASFAGASLQATNLQDTQLSSARIKTLDQCVDEQNICENPYQPVEDLPGADLQGANLRWANLQGADLRGVRNLTLEQLATVKTLYRALLDPPLLEVVGQQYPHLLEEPR